MNLMCLSIGDKDYIKYVLKQREVTMFMDPLLEELEDEYKLEEYLKDMMFYDSRELIKAELIR